MPLRNGRVPEDDFEERNEAVWKTALTPRAACKETMRYRHIEVCCSCDESGGTATFQSASAVPEPVTHADTRIGDWRRQKRIWQGKWPSAGCNPRGSAKTQWHTIYLDLPGEAATRPDFEVDPGSIRAKPAAGLQ